MEPNNLLVDVRDALEAAGMDAHVGWSLYEETRFIVTNHAIEWADCPNEACKFYYKTYKKVDSLLDD